MSTLWLAAFAMLSGPVAASAKGAREPATVSLALRWHVVTTGTTPSTDEAVPSASNRYLVLADSANTISADSYTLLNTSTDQQIPVSAPDCPEGPSDATLGGPYLAVQCAIPISADSNIPDVELLNLSTGFWQTKPLDPNVCVDQEAGCELSAVGVSWLRFTTPPMTLEHGTFNYFRQNISTGTVEGDDVTDSLDNATGVSHPCVPVPSGSRDEDFLGAGSEPEEFTQLGPFLLSTGVVDASGAVTAPIALRSCVGERARYPIPSSPWASNDMVVWNGPDRSGTDDPLTGLALPGPRPFTVHNSVGAVVAVSNNTIYELTYPAGNLSRYEIWSATVPTQTLR